MISSRPRPVGRRRLGARARPSLPELGAFSVPSVPAHAALLIPAPAAVRGRRRRRRSSAAADRPDPRRQLTAGASQPSRRRRVLSIFMLASFGSSAVDPHEAGTHFGPEVGLRRAGTRRTRRGRSAAPSSTSTATITRSPTGSSGTAYTASRPHVRVRADDRLDRRGGEVLAVDAQPLVRAAGEVEPAVGVAVGEVARPVEPSRNLASVAPPRCGSSPRTPSPVRSRRSRRPRPRGSSSRPSRLELGAAGTPRRSRDRTPSTVVVGRAERAGRHRRVAADDDDALGRAVAVAHVAAEAARRTRGCRASDASLPEREPERVVGVVGLLGGTARM